MNSNERRSSQIISKLFALHMAQLKMFETKLVYIDMANIRLTPTHLVIGAPTHKTNSGIHIQLAICQHEGLLGFQIYSALPSTNEIFLAKLKKKMKGQKYTLVMMNTGSDERIKEKEVPIIALASEKLN